MQNNKRGFTLIEILVVVSIIGMLSSFVLASMSDAKNNAKTKAGMQALSNIIKQGEIYYSANGNYGEDCILVDGTKAPCEFVACVTPVGSNSFFSTSQNQSGAVQLVNYLRTLVSNPISDIYCRYWEDKKLAISARLADGKIYCSDN